ncbi:MAG: alkaline phosphatase D family protein, partial [Gemmataceae bacterium]
MRSIVLPGCLLALLLPFVAGAEPAVSITTGPILGRLDAHGIGVWGRTDRPGTFRVRYGAAENKLDQLSDPVKTSLDHDNTGWVHITKLKANTKYWYELTDAEGNRIAAGGSFRTLPDAADFKDATHNPRGLFNFRFEFACGNNQDEMHGSGPALPAFKTMLDNLKDKVNFAILNGDWLYEDRREFSAADWLKANGLTRKDEPRIVRLAPTICGVWENYKIYLSRGKNLAAWHRNMPSFFTFDDHEILNDVWGAGTPGRRNRRAVFRDIGVRAWYDYLGWANPTPFKQAALFGKTTLKKGSDVLEDPEADFSKLDLDQAATLLVHWGTPTAGVNDNKLDEQAGDPNASVYGIDKIVDKTHLKITPAARADSTQSYSIGRRNYFKMTVSNCDFFVCDTRTHRQMHDTKDAAKKGVSMLGVDQKKWLMDGMKASQADFFFVVSSVNFMVP